MKKLVIFILIFMVFFCSKETKNLMPNFDDFIYVNLNLKETNSLKFSGNDTLYLQKRFPEKPDEYYFTIINSQLKDSLIKRINKLTFEKYKPGYISQNTEGENLQFLIICRNEKPEFVSVSEKNEPSEIRTFRIWLKKLKTEVKFIKRKEYINFWNNKNILVPPPPPIVKDIKFKYKSR